MRRGKRIARWAVPALLWTAGFPWGAAAAEPVRTEPVVVTATRIEEKVSEQASSVSVLTREEIERDSPMLVGDLLRRLPGIDVQRNGSPGSLENIKIRGGIGMQTLVLIDGFPVNSPGTSNFDISSLAPDMFEQVEIVRGPQSALYGSYASAGVVNFIPRKGAEGAEYRVGLAGGSFETVKGSGSASAGNESGHFLLAGTSLRSSGILPNDGTELTSFIGTGDLRIGDNQRVHFLLLSTDGKKQVPIDQFSPRDINHLETRRGVLTGVRWDSKISDTVAVSVSGGSYDEYLHIDDPPDPTDAFPFPFDDVTKSRRSLVSVQGRYFPGKISTTIVGAEFEKDRITDTFNPASSTFNRSLYLQEEWRPYKGVGVSLGGRLDRTSVGGTVFNPKVAAYREFQAVPIKIRGAAGRGFRPPTASEKFDPFIGNPNLSPETAMSYEAGADLAVGGGRGTISTTGFFNQYRGLILFSDRFPGPLGFGEMRNVDAISRGLEVYSSWQLTQIVGVAGSYTYSNTWDKLNGRRILAIPNQRGSLSVLVEPIPRFEGRVDWRVESEMLDKPPNGPVQVRPGYSRVDASGRYRWRTAAPGSPEVAFTGKIGNLLNRRYEERKEYPAPRINFLLGAEVKI